MKRILTISPVAQIANLYKVEFQYPQQQKIVISLVFVFGPNKKINIGFKRINQ